uniref:Uncharacterized protein n=1 Tax=Pseudomonas phage Baskent_P1_112 TaxID=3145032 RepID=A0AAU8BAJ4_9CAUD
MDPRVFIRKILGYSGGGSGGISLDPLLTSHDTLC